MQQLKSSVVNSMIIGQNHFCCLCFKTVADSAVHINDVVIVKKHDNTYHEVFMTDILTTVLGSEIMDQLSIFDEVCNECSSGAIKSYKFYTKCKDNSQKLGHVIDGLQNGTEILCQTNSKSVKAGFVYINTENFAYRGYNSYRTATTGLLAYRKFQNLQYKYEFIKKPAMKFVPRSNYRANEKVKILRLRLVQLNPMVLKKHSRVFVCPKCDHFFVRKYSMHLHYRKKHLSDGEDFPFNSSNIVKTNECDNLTNLEPYRLCSETIKKTNKSHSVISKVKVKIEPEKNEFVEPYRLCSEPIIKTNGSHSVISKVKIEPEENRFVEPYRLGSEPIIITNESHLVISKAKVKIEPEDNGFVAAFRTYLDENKK